MKKSKRTIELTIERSEFVVRRADGGLVRGVRRARGSGRAGSGGPRDGPQRRDCLPQAGSGNGARRRDARRTPARVPRFAWFTGFLTAEDWSERRPRLPLSAGGANKPHVATLVERKRRAAAW
jgi:hypothetical protein